jgi:hypothetical protein
MAHTGGDMIQTLEFSRESYTRTVCCADVYASEVVEQKPDGTKVCAPIPVPRFCGKGIEPGDLLLIDPVRTPQTGDWVYVGEGPGFCGIPGIGGHRFKEYPCQESVLGVIVDHFPAVQGGQTGWSASVVLANGEKISDDQVYVCSYNDSLAESAAMAAAREFATALAVEGVKVSTLVTSKTAIEGRKNIVFFPGPCEQY